MFDRQGNLRSWWTNATQKKFKEKADCVINQHSSILDPASGINLNGVNTQGEDIADLGGTRESYLAFINHVKKNGPEPLIPYLTEYTPEQIFYLAYSNVWCGSKTKQSLINQIKYDPHSPARYRVNVPLMNAESFSKAFNCPDSSKMNIKNRCIVW